MKKGINFGFLLGILVCSLAISGCGKKADTNKSVDQIHKEVEAMSVNDLEGYAKAYANEILAKKSDVEQLTQKLKSIPVTELFGDKAKSLKDDLSKIGSDVSALSDRYQVYVQKFQEKGGDLSKVKI